jgi:nicotinamidase-related amidase
MTSRKPALLCIDMQYLDAARGFGVFRDMDNCPISSEEADYYFDRLDQFVFPNSQRLLKLFRDRGLDVIHIRIMSQTSDGRDRTYWHKKLGLHCAPGSRESEFMPQVAPLAGETIVSKTSSGAFGSSNLDTILRNAGITDLYMCGVYTHECVESTIRGGADFGYNPVMVDDATGATSNAIQQDCVMRLKDRYCEVLTTAEVEARFAPRGQHD